MDKVTAFLKKKGPLGMPMAFWAGFAAIALYLGYRWYSGRSGSSSSDSSSTDTSGDSTDDSGGGSIATGTDTGSGAIDTPTPSGGLTLTPIENPPKVSTGGGTTTPKEPVTGVTKKPKPKPKPATHHDKKQGTTHTKKKVLPKPKSAKHHAPKKAPKKSSKTKTKQVKAIGSSHVRNLKGTSGPPKGGSLAHPAVKAAPRKAPPAPIHHPSEPAKGAKAPPKKPSISRKAA